jgi:hypothetical protein
MMEATSKEKKRKEKEKAYGGNRVKKTLIRQRAFKTVLVALVTARVTGADGLPSGSHLGTTAREQQVIVQLILSYRRPAAPDHPTRRRAFEGDHDDRSVLRDENMASETIRVGLPTKRITLCRPKNGSFFAVN